VTRTALFLSPHLDDVAFSCGALAALLRDQGWRTVLATAFTRSVVPAEGFALACQLDKGLDAGVDYMALRRDEDREAARILGFAECLHLGLPEAPHRGYDSAPALFAGVRDDDRAWAALEELVAGLERRVAPALVLAPQGLGGHVDHLQMARAVREGVLAPVWWYRDTPYAIRHGDAPCPAPLAGLGGIAVAADAGLERKVAAACAYRSQVGFQFGGEAGTAAALLGFARDEAQRALAAGEAVESGEPESGKPGPGKPGPGGSGRAAADAAERFLGSAGACTALSGAMRGAA